GNRVPWRAFRQVCNHFAPERARFRELAFLCACQPDEKARPRLVGVKRKRLLERSDCIGSHDPASRTNQSLAEHGLRTSRWTLQRNQLTKGTCGILKAPKTHVNRRKRLPTLRVLRVARKMGLGPADQLLNGGTSRIAFHPLR